MTHLPQTAIATATKHLRDILSLAIEYHPSQAALVVSDAQCALAVALTQAYRICLPAARFIDFDAVSPEEVLAAIDQLTPDDLVVLIQSTNFRLEAYRIRIELFNRSLKVIEHPHLSRMQAAEALRYIEALAYDITYYREVGHALKKRIDQAQSGTLDSGGEQLFFNAPLSPPSSTSAITAP